MAEIKGTIRSTTQNLTGNIKSMGVKGDKGDPALRERRQMRRKSGTK